MPVLLLFLIALAVSHWQLIYSYFSNKKATPPKLLSPQPDPIPSVLKRIFLENCSVYTSDTSRPFAAMMGIPGQPKMFISQSILKTFTSPEIEYVVLHEVGHYRSNHTLKFAMLYLLLCFGASTTLILFPNIFMAIILGIVISVLLIQYGRMQEYEAENFALRHLEDKQPVITATQKFSSSYISFSSPLLTKLLTRGIPYSTRIKMAQTNSEVK